MDITALETLLTVRGVTYEFIGKSDVRNVMARMLNSGDGDKRLSDIPIIAVGFMTLEALAGGHRAAKTMKVKQHIRNGFMVHNC